MNEEVWEELYDQSTATRKTAMQVHKHNQELALNHAAFFELVRLVDRQQERIARLEKIIVSMANGLVTTYPEAGEIHTHQIYPCNGVQNLMEEIKSPSPDPPPDYLWGDGKQASNQAGQSRLVGEEPEPDGARWRDPDGVQWVRLCPVDLAQDEHERQMDEETRINEAEMWGPEGRPEGLYL